MPIGKGRLWPGKLTWNASDLGFTRGGTAVVATPSWKEEKVDQYGDTPVNRWGYGMAKVEASIALSEMTAARLATLTNEPALAGPSLKIHATTNIGYNQLSGSSPLKVFPIISGVASATAQMHLPLAYPMFDLNLPFSDKPQEMKGTFGAYPDENDSNTIAIFNEI